MELAGDLRMGREDRLGAIECAGTVPAVERDTRGVDEGCQWICFDCHPRPALFSLVWLT